MENTRGFAPTPAQNQPEALARLLRHEVGDLLQTVYATVAILQERLPPQLSLERRILGDLRTRAEATKVLLDNVHDLVSPASVGLERVDLAELAGSLIAALSARYPAIEVRAEALAVPPVKADPRRLTQLGRLLLETAFESAQHQVTSRIAPGPGRGEVSWMVTDDGAGVPDDQLDRLFSPLSTTRHGPLGFGLALIQKLALLQGGHVTAANLPGGGFRVDVVLREDQ